MAVDQAVANFKTLIPLLKEVIDGEKVALYVEKIYLQQLNIFAGDSYALFLFLAAHDCKTDRTLARDALVQK